MYNSRPYNLYEAYLNMYSQDLTEDEQYLYDVVLSHLLDEGYAETSEAAEAIMLNMSEDWLQDIVEVTGGGHISMDDTKYTKKRSPAQKTFDERGPKSRSYVTGSREQHPVRNRLGGSRSPAGTESGLSMTPRERAELAAKRAAKKGQGKRASKIRRIINPPTESNFFNYK